MRYDLRWTMRAAERLASVVDDLSANSVAAPRRFLDALERTLEIVATHPDAHPLLTNVIDAPTASGLRYAKAKGYKVVIQVAHHGATVFIRGIRHDRERRDRLVADL